MKVQAKDRNPGSTQVALLIRTDEITVENVWNNADESTIKAAVQLLLERFPEVKKLLKEPA